MIIGNGDIASALTDHPDRIYFASGVSNSTCSDKKEFKRERNLLDKIDCNKHIVYFSTLSIYYANSYYTEHKADMEDRIMSWFKSYTIVRLGNITWGKNPNTIINYLKSKINNNMPYEIKDTQRYLCSKEEFQHWMNLIPDFNTEMNITGERVSVKEIETRIKAGIL